MPDLSQLFAYAPPANAKSDRSGSHGIAIAAAAKSFAAVIIEHMAGSQEVDELLDSLAGVVKAAQAHVAGGSLEKIAAPQAPVATMGEEREAAPQPAPIEGDPD